MIVEDEAFIFDGKAIERMFKNQLKPPTPTQTKEKPDMPAKKATDKDKPKKKLDEQEAWLNTTLHYNYTTLHCTALHYIPTHCIPLP